MYLKLSPDFPEHVRHNFGCIANDLGEISTQQNELMALNMFSTKIWLWNVVHHLPKMWIISKRIFNLKWVLFQSIPFNFMSTDFLDKMSKHGDHWNSLENCKKRTIKSHQPPYPARWGINHSVAKKINRIWYNYQGKKKPPRSHSDLRLTHDARKF